MTRPVHFEILADDPHKICAFYEAAFDWKINQWGDQPYWLVTSGPEDVPGIDGAIMGRDFDQAVINTMEVESLEASLEKVKAAGGEVIHGPDTIPGVGTHAYCADPEGNLFGLMQPAAEMG